jgi:hypothetical protein
MRAILLMLCIGFVFPSFSQTFPTLQCENLNGKKINIPQDVSGKKTVVALALSAKAEKSLREWNQPLYNSLLADGLGGLMGGRMYDANVCFVGMVRGIAKLATGEIRERSRRNIDKKLHEHFMLSEQDIDPLISETHITDKNEPQFFVLDKDGQIVYHTSGKFSDAKLNGLTEKLMQ